MIIIIDVQYHDPEDQACIGTIIAKDWSDPSPAFSIADQHHGLQSYESGAFYRRELPCILPVLQRLLQQHPIKTIVIDGYVDVAPDHAGLGRHLFQALNSTIEIIGVAKNEFKDTHATPIFRGESSRPLWVTSTSDQALAASNIKNMHGVSRIPTLLRLADKLAREDCLHPQ